MKLKVERTLTARTQLNSGDLDVFDHRPGIGNRLGDKRYLVLNLVDPTTFVYGNTVLGFNKERCLRKTLDKIKYFESNGSKLGQGEGGHVKWLRRR